MYANGAGPASHVIRGPHGKGITDHSFRHDRLLRPALQFDCQVGMVAVDLRKVAMVLWSRLLVHPLCLPA